MSPKGTRGAGHQGAPNGGGLGTFAGVFTPSALTILGIILFLRLGYVVGGAGLGRALLIIGLANLISVLTSFSLAAIATNLRVKKGGDYYLISRTLGVEFGGALGLVLFAAQSISVAFYAIGFGEAVAAMAAPDLAWLPQAVAAVAVLALLPLAWFGADVATRFQYVVMAVLVSSIVAFFAGGLPHFELENVRANWTPSGDLSFWLLFAIFFPAVTGFTQGVSMSGDLKDPSRSLPLGTFLAVGVSILVYFGVAVVFAGVVPGTDLVSDFMAMRRVSVVPWLIDAGVIAATLSSALASFLGAPRILQSLAEDRVFPILNPFAVGHGPGSNPRRGVLLSLGIALATVALGNLNVIAPLVSMFFLISYGLLNFATYYESRAKSPSFRPTFRWHRAEISLAGALACGAVMLAIDPLAGAIAGAILFAILQYVRRTVHVSRWADSSRSRMLQQIRESLFSLSASPEHPRDWRPIIVAFSEDQARRVALLRFASWIEGGAGFTSVLRILDAREKAPPAEQLAEVEDEIRRDIATAGVSAFARAVFSSEPDRVLPALLRTYGIGEVRANTVLLNRLAGEASEIDEARRVRFGGQLAMALRAGSNLVVLDADPEDVTALDSTPVDGRRIDVWYQGDATGKLCLLFAYLTTRTPDWKDAAVRVITPRSGKKSEESVRTELQTMLDEVRIHAEPVVVNKADPEGILETSREASLVFLPFTLRGDRAVGPTGRPLADAAKGLAVVAFVMAAQDLELDAAPEEGQHAEIVKVLDRAEQADKLAREADKAAEAADKEAAEARSATDERAAKRRALESREKAESARRAAAEARAEVEPGSAPDPTPPRKTP